MKVLKRRCECNGEFNSNGQGECNTLDEGGPFCYVDRYMDLFSVMWTWDFYNERLQNKNTFCHRSYIYV